MRFIRKPENGLKKIWVKMPPRLIEHRRNILSYAREVCGDIPVMEMEASLIEGSWRDALRPLEITGAVHKERTTMERVILYNDTLWEIEEFFNNLMLKGCQGGVRAFYALLMEAR